MNPYTEWAMASLAVLLPAMAVAAVAWRMGCRHGRGQRDLDAELDAPFLPPEPVTATEVASVATSPIAAITAPGEMFRESGHAPRHAATMPRREIAFGGDFPHTGPVYRPYTHPIDRERLPLESDTGWMERITDEFLIRHGLNP
jgi:hypothetical protein